MVEENRWVIADVNELESVSYMIKCYQANCQECQQSPCSRICTSPECSFLCYHMYSCDSRCYSYNNGHICEHIHRVHSLSNMRNNLTSNEETSLDNGTIQEKAGNSMDTNDKAIMLEELHAPPVSVSKPPSSG